MIIITTKRRWFVSGRLLDLAQNVHIECRAEQEALNGWQVAFGGDRLDVWGVRATDIDLLPEDSEARLLIEELWALYGKGCGYIHQTRGLEALKT